MNCDWNNPGINPYKGSLDLALKNYNLSSSQILELKYRINRSDFDTIVYIGKDYIRAPFGYSSELKNMHWGTNTMCNGIVNRSLWPDREELATVYCYDGINCIAIPKICGNISQINYTRQEKYIPKYYDEYTHKINVVSEPSTLLLSILILTVLNYVKRKTSRRF